MTSLSRTEFARELARNGGALNINDLSPELQNTLDSYGITHADLEKVAGSDGKISGKAEFKKLFAVVDTLDNDGKSTTIRVRDELVDGASTPTAAGDVYDALKKDVAAYRAMANNRGVIHLGMRKASKHEVKALNKAAAKDGGVHAIKAWATDGKVVVDGTEYDLTTKDGLKDFTRKCEDLGMKPDLAKEFSGLIEQQTDSVRDEFALLGLALFKVGEGKLHANRLVLSGHSGGDSVMDDNYVDLYFGEISKLADIFKEGAAKIEHVAVSACNCGFGEQVDLFRQAFPNLKSYMGYVDSSPKAETNAPKHLKKWEAMTDGDDPSRVDPFTGVTSTWNVADGYQGRTESLQEIEDNVALYESAWTPYATGKKKPVKGTSDYSLDQYYRYLTRLEYHPDISADRKAEVSKLRKEVLNVRLQMH